MQHFSNFFSGYSKLMYDSTQKDAKDLFVNDALE